jgi:8-oxo-dGTP diphosphatase
MIETNTFINEVDFTGSKGIVFVGDRIVVTRRDGNTDRHPFKLDLLGGGREGEESPFETFKREVKEEVNLVIEKEFVEKDILLL